MKFLVCFFALAIGVCLGQTLCPPANIPVCCHYADGSSETFINACVMEAENTENNRECESMAQGECGAVHILPYPLFKPQDGPFIHPRA